MYLKSSAKAEMFEVDVAVQQLLIMLSSQEHIKPL